MLMMLQTHSYIPLWECNGDKTKGKLQVVDEEGSPYAAENAKAFGGNDGQNGIADDTFARSQLKHSINGASCCNRLAFHSVWTAALITQLAAVESVHLQL